MTVSWPESRYEQFMHGMHAPSQKPFPEFSVHSPIRHISDMKLHAGKNLVLWYTIATEQFRKHHILGPGQYDRENDSCELLRCYAYSQ